MARRGRPTVEVQLSEDERETLERWARRPRSEQSLALPVQDRALLCRRALEHRGGSASVGGPGDDLKVAAALCRLAT